MLFMVPQLVLLTAARTLASLSPAKHDKNANLLQPLTKIRKIARTIAIATAKEAVKSGLTKYNNLSDVEITALIDEATWVPEYLPYKFKQP
jgi:malate dehydrogenase (oxaloacetate-decarboxylating)